MHLLQFGRSHPLNIGANTIVEKGKTARSIEQVFKRWGCTLWLCISQIILKVAVHVVNTTICIFSLCSFNLYLCYFPF